MLDRRTNCNNGQKERKQKSDCAVEGDGQQQQRKKSGGVGGLYGSLFAELAKELKLSNSGWELISSRAIKLATHLQQTSSSLSSFVDALQSVSDNASNVNGVTRDIGAPLTRFCLRQRAIESAMRQWSHALQQQCADELGRRSGDWLQTVSDLERRYQRSQKRLIRAAKGNGSTGTMKALQQMESESQSFYVELLHAQRAQYTEFVVGALLPVINAQLALLDEGARVRQVRDSIEAAVNGNETAIFVQALLEDIACRSGPASGRGAAPKQAEEEQHNWDQRVGLGMAQSRAKSASQARLYGGDEDDYSLYGSTTLMEHRNSMPPPAIDSQQFWSSCPSSAVATISSSSSSVAVVVGSLPHGCLSTRLPPSNGTVGMFDDANQHNATKQQNRIPTVCHQRMPIPVPFVQSAPPVMSDQASLSPVVSPQHSQKPPLPYNNNNNNRGAVHQQNEPAQTVIINQQAAYSTLQPRCSAHTMVDANSQICTQFPPPPPPIVPQHSSNTGDLATHRISVDRDSGSHCSSSLIAETLQQIDRLGVELDNYCEGLDEMDSIGSGGSEKQSYGGPSMQVADNQQQPGPSSSSVRFRPDALHIVAQQTQGNEVVSPSKAPLPPPLPPQRRNSAISAATPTAPSIADLRSAGAAVASSSFGPIHYHPPLFMPPQFSQPIKNPIPPSPSPMPQQQPSKPKQ